MAPLFCKAVLPKPQDCSHRAWRVMLSGGSLTRQLQRSGAVFSVHLLREGASRLRRDERLALGSGAMTAWAREVVLCLDGRPVVLARSVARWGAVQRAWRRATQLGSRPLGEVLWCDPAVRRGTMCYAWLAPQSVTAEGYDIGRLPARRSIFWRQGCPLLVMEVFLPALQEFF